MLDIVVAILYLLLVAIISICLVVAVVSLVERNSAEPEPTETPSDSD